MTTIDAKPTPESSAAGKAPKWMTRKHWHHWRTSEDEFDACKLGMWLFLTTEVLLFAGIFVAYALFRIWYPESFQAGSHSLDWRWGALNTLILLLSSFTVAFSIRNAQLNQRSWLVFNLAFTLVCAALFLVIKFTFEYGPKWSDGKRPGMLFSYTGAETSHEHIWWSVYYCATGIHALHVVIGAAILFVIMIKAMRGHYGPRHYTGVEVAGLYWHLVDVIWIFLFPLLYLIH